MSYTIGKIRLEDLASEDEDDDSYAGENDVKQSSESSDEDDRVEQPTKKRKLDEEVKEKEKVLSLVDDFWASMKEESTPASATISKTSTITTSSQTIKTQGVTTNSITTTTTASKISTASSLDLMFQTDKEKEKEEVKTFKFAGELIQLTAKEAESVGAKVATNPKKGASAAPNNNMSSILDSLKGKKKITTIQKSTLDWGKYKKEEKLEDELEQQKKDGYLEKQAFLQRADLRQFEVERGARLKERQVNYKKSIGS